MVSLRGLLLVILPSLPVAAEDHRPAGTSDIRRTYQDACAVCHGPKGRYDPSLSGVKALDPKPADFTDPLFNSREPASDWRMVVKHGGAEMGFSPSMPSYSSVFSDEKIAGLVGYLKTLAGEHPYPDGDLNFLLPFRTKKAWLEDEVVYYHRYVGRDGDDVIYNALEFEKRLFARWQIELKLSHEFEGGDEAWDEFEAGLKYAAYDSVEKQVIVSAGVDWAFPLKGGGASIEAIPFLALGKGLGDQFSLQASAKSHLPIEHAADGDVEFATALHWMPSPWPRSINPAVELTAHVPFHPGDRDSVQWTVLPHLNIGLNRRGNVRAAAGVEFPLSDQDYEWRFQFYLLWDFADGMFWEGWRRRGHRTSGEFE
jgi:mono/diheme cytochrome c family protein